MLSSTAPHTDESQRPISVTKQDHSGGTADVPDGVAYFAGRNRLRARSDRGKKSGIDTSVPIPSYNCRRALTLVDSSAVPTLDEPSIVPTELAQSEEEGLASEKVCEERMAVYVRTVEEPQAEIYQRIAEHASRQSELDQLKERQDRGMERDRHTCEEHERRHEESEQRIRELLEAQQMSEAGRDEEERRPLGMQRQSDPVRT